MYNRVEFFLSENTLFLDKMCKNCTGLLEPVEFTGSGPCKFTCTQCRTSYDASGQELPTYGRTKAANEELETVNGIGETDSGLKYHIGYNVFNSEYETTLLGGEFSNLHGSGKTQEEAVKSLESSVKMHRILRRRQEQRKQAAANATEET